MKSSKISYLFPLVAVLLFSSCSTDVKLGKAVYYGMKYKIIAGQLGGLNYIMLSGHGKNKYPLTVDFRQDMKPFFAMKTTESGNKFFTWHSVTDTAGNIFQSFGVTLVEGAGLRQRTFMPISEDDKKILYDFSNILSLKRPGLSMSKDSVNRLIGWVKVDS